MKPALAALALIALPVLASALTVAEPYQSGKDLCTKPLPEEIGFFVETPIDYKNPQRGTSPIYAWTLKDFDAAKPSVVYFVGGPGGTPHGYKGLERLAEGYNVVYFDPRGVKCSRPTDKALMTDAAYFSSENTARDAEEIRKHLGVDKWSVIGHSYGTVTATINGHLFPERTTAVILEGIIYDGTTTLWEAPHRLKILDRFLAKLPGDLREKVISWSRRADVPPEWFSAKAQSIMYQNFPLVELEKQLTDLFKLSDAEIVKALNSGETKMFDLLLNMDIPDFGSFLFLHIACRELTGQSESAYFLSVFDENGKLKPATNSPVKKLCKDFGWETTAESRYESSRYPLTVPVTYFQGGHDGATTAEMGISHWKKVPRGPKQLVIFPKGGHSSTGSFDTPSLPVYRAALEGRKITREMVDTANASNELKMVFTNKGF